MRKLIFIIFILLAIFTAILLYQNSNDEATGVADEDVVDETEKIDVSNDIELFSSILVDGENEPTYVLVDDAIGVPINKIDLNKLGIKHVSMIQLIENTDDFNYWYNTSTNRYVLIKKGHTELLQLMKQK